MNEDLHIWMNRKSTGKPLVRIRTYAKPGAVWSVSHSSPENDPSVYPTFVREIPLIMDEAAGDEMVSGITIRETSFSDKPISDAVSHKWPTRWRQSPLISGLMIVSGAVMVGLLMGWTVLTLLAPIPAG